MIQGKIETKIICSCGAAVDGFSGVNKDERPEDGDISICFYCAGIGKYAENLTKINTMTEEELKSFSQEEPELYVQVMITQKRIKNLIYSRDKK